MSISTAVFQATLLVGAVCCAPPIEPELDATEAALPVNTTTIIPAVTEAIIEKSDSIENDKNNEVTVAQTIEATTLGYFTSPPPPPTAPALSGPERHALISHLSEYDLRTVDPLVLTPRQQFAILQELEHQKLGLPPFTDPTSWQRLTREQQMEFNRKYLALRGDLQEYSRNQFLSLPEDRQAHAYQAFLSVDIKTLSQAIEREFAREREALKQQNIVQKQNIIKEQQALEEQQKIADLYREQQRIGEQQRIAEQQRVVEQQRIAEQQSIAEQQTIEEQQRIAEQRRFEEQQIFVEQQSSLEKQRLFEQEQKLAELNILVEQQSFQEDTTKVKQQGLVEDNILAEQVRLYEQQKLAFEQSLSENLKHIEQQEALEKQRQEGINKLFEVALSQQDGMVTAIEEPRSQSRKMIHSSQELNEISNAMFEHAEPLKLTARIIKANTTSKQRNRQFKPKFLNLLTKHSQYHTPPSLRELQRQQKRLNIRRLMFDPRRSQ